MLNQLRRKVKVLKSLTSRSLSRLTFMFFASYIFPLRLWDCTKVVYLYFNSNSMAMLLTSISMQMADTICLQYFIKTWHLISEIATNFFLNRLSCASFLLHRLWSDIIQHVLASICVSYANLSCFCYFFANRHPFVLQLTQSNRNRDFVGKIKLNWKKNKIIGTLVETVFTLHFKFKFTTLLHNTHGYTYMPGN